MNVMVLARELGYFPKEALNELYNDRKIRVHRGLNNEIIELIQ